jgi:hypothetical protein
MVGLHEKCWKAPIQVCVCTHGGITPASPKANMCNQMSPTVNKQSHITMSDQHKVMYHELLTCVYLSGTQLAQQLHPRMQRLK